MATSSKTLPTKLEKKVLVSTSDFDVYCEAFLRMAHNETAKQGSITISFKADLANFDGKLQVLRLIVPPETIEECALKRNSNDDLLPFHLVENHPARPKKKSEVLTLTLKLNLPGVVWCPSGTETLRPAAPGDLEFRSFAKISRSKSFCLHFSKRQFVKDQPKWLDIFISALNAKCLQSEPLDHCRKDWSVSRLSPEPPEPPPYDEDPPPYHGNAMSARWVGKRRRESGSLSPSNNERRKRRLLGSPQLIDSPTEVNTPSSNTPSALSPSPASIRPTRFTRASSRDNAEHKVVAHLEHILRDVSDDTIREVLTQSGRQHLLAPPNDRERDLRCAVENVGFGAVEMAERRLKRYVDQMFQSRLQPLVDDIMTDCLDQLRAELRQHEAEFSDHVDDCKCEVSQTAKDCMMNVTEEMQEWQLELAEKAQQYLDNIENGAIEVKTAKEEFAELKRWLDNSPRSLFRSKSSPTLALGADARRSSI